MAQFFKKLELSFRGAVAQSVERPWKGLSLVQLYFCSNQAAS